MQVDAKLGEALARFEPVEWLYDGLNGKIIAWTLNHENTNHDPSVLAFVVGRDGRVFASLVDGKQHQAASLVRWLDEQHAAYEKAHPPVRLPFVRAAVRVEGEGAEATVSLPALEEARAARRPVAVYAGRDRVLDEKSRAERSERQRSRAFEEKVLDGKAAEREAEGWTFLRLDLADPAHARAARALGVTEAPALLLYAPDAKAAVALDRRATASTLAHHLRRLREPAASPGPTD